MALSSASFDAIAHFPGGSTLSKRFGKETLNYYAGNPLNRLSFLRSNTTFLRSARTHANFVLLKDLNALHSPNPAHLAFLSFPDITRALGSAHELNEDELVTEYDSSSYVNRRLLFIFLGLDEEYTIEQERGQIIAEGDRFQFGGYTGRPYFAVDVTESTVYTKLRSAIESVSQGGFQQNLQLVPKEAAILAQARSLIDWNHRNQFCSACGSRTVSTHAGTKRVCPATDRTVMTAGAGAGAKGTVGAEDKTPKGRPSCISRKGIHNIAFPRTDPVVIMAIVNVALTHVLVGRKATWPQDVFSALAGFCEPAESIEDAVRRETWEESGVRVGRVVVHSSQPWPFPSSLMIGCIGEAIPDGEEIHPIHDRELENVQWIPILGLKEKLERNSANFGGPPPTACQEGDMRFPPPTAIAHQLLLAVANCYHLPIPPPEA